MKLADAAKLQVGWPLRHRWTGDRAVLLGVDPAGRLLVHFDGQPAGCNTGIHADVMADGTQPVEPIYDTEDTAGYASCSRCQDIYATGPGDRADNCHRCGPVYWEPEPAPGRPGNPAASDQTDQTDPWVQQYATEVRTAVLVYHRVDSCIESTRVGAEVARYYGQHLEPVPTAVGYFTAEAWSAQGRTGYSIGVTGTGRVTAGAWDGHLVGLLGPWLVDFAADLLHRPDRGINVPGPFIAPVTADQLAEGVAITDTTTGVVRTYRAVPDTTWRNAPAWARRSPAVRGAAAAAIRALQTFPQEAVPR